MYAQNGGPDPVHAAPANLKLKQLAESKLKDLQQCFYDEAIAEGMEWNPDAWPGSPVKDPSCRDVQNQYTYKMLGYMIAQKYKLPDPPSMTKNQGAWYWCLNGHLNCSYALGLGVSRRTTS